TFVANRPSVHGTPNVISAFTFNTSTRVLGYANVPEADYKIQYFGKDAAGAETVTEFFVAVTPVAEQYAFEVASYNNNNGELYLSHNAPANGEQP
ncbi:hypothetical protein, partial [Enterobacter hormaechei]|uniref:hypothetical protein n=1 Tax=Enterobacter hormaechei TaxID=158836 RepID=UPI001980875A